MRERERGRRGQRRLNDCFWIAKLDLSSLQSTNCCKDTSALRQRQRRTQIQRQKPTQTWPQPSPEYQLLQCKDTSENTQWRKVSYLHSISCCKDTFKLLLRSTSFSLKVKQDFFYCSTMIMLSTSNIHRRQLRVNGNSRKFEIHKSSWWVSRAYGKQGRFLGEHDNFYGLELDTSLSSSSCASAEWKCADTGVR